MLKRVFIEPSCSAKAAEEIINDCIKQYQDEDTKVEFELLLENATQVGHTSYIYYTVVIELYDRETTDV